MSKYSISVTNDVSLITLENLPNKIDVIADIFNSIGKESINVDMISQITTYSGVSDLSFTISDTDIVKALNVIGRYKKTIPELVTEINSNNVKISLYGKEMETHPGIAATLFSLMANNIIEIKLITTSVVDISLLIHEKDANKAIDSIKKNFETEN